MASTNQTETLGLNQWVSSDIPKMADFNADNLKVEQAVADHVQDDEVHLSQSDRALLEQLTPVTGSYVGDGEETYVLQLGFQPSWGVIYASGKPICVTVEDGATTQVSVAFCSQYGQSVGCYPYNNRVELFQESEGYGGYRMNMNQQGVTYCYRFYR